MRQAALPAPEKWAGKRSSAFRCHRVWLREDKYYSYRHGKIHRRGRGKFFHTEQLVKLLDDHKNGKADNSRRVWTVYTFLVGTTSSSTTTTCGATRRNPAPKTA